MHLTDLLPTFVAAAGGNVDPAWHVDGANLLANWTGKGPAPERTLFWEWRSEGSDQLAALRGQLKLVITRGGKPELFDVEADLAERRDISAQHPEMTRQLRAELNAWLETETRQLSFSHRSHLRPGARPQVRTSSESRCPSMATRFSIFDSGATAMSPSSTGTMAGGPGADATSSDLGQLQGRWTARAGLARKSRSS